MAEHFAYISIGSNLGDSMQNCCKGIDALCEDGLVELITRSPCYKTAPVDYLMQNWFINAVLYVKTRLTPFSLLDKIQSIQKRLGRKSDTVRFGPRILDLDIIFYDDMIIDSPRLVIPHPRMHKRRFVLQPICDIDPSIMHPGLGRNVQDLLTQLVTDDQDIMPCSFDC
ncbi:MAG: 2-amino-4-hydroxy-6-hydroxymethyldihydropteridine diphosphokinase [Desulfobacteraceae bacterium]|jgi:2-amino-4-hydroxy-6-hydroxymethyldihydropteridine diphosphokinase